MPLKFFLAASAATLALAVPALAGDAVIKIMDPYARAASPSAKSGAAFMMLMNHGTEDDRLIAATSDVAKKVELHTHIEDANGVMQMRHDPDGFEIPAGGSHALARGGDHVMFMGLNGAFEQGATVPLTLVFESGEEITLEVPVDNDRMDGMGHGNH